MLDITTDAHCVFDGYSCTSDGGEEQEQRDGGEKQEQRDGGEEQDQRDSDNCCASGGDLRMQQQRS